MTASKPATATERTAQAKRRLLEAGGRRMTLNLSPEAAAALERISTHHAMNATEAVEWALLQQARACRAP